MAHSSYLITLVAGEYTVLKDKFDGADVLYYVTPGREADAPRTFGNTPEMMRLFSDLTGQKYPYPRYAQITVAEFIFGGMENTSATTITDQTLHDERAHADFSSEPLISHELAHQWFGDLLTCRDWSHGWLNEGFATYFEILWKEHSAGRDEADYDRLGDMEAYVDEDAHRYRRPVVTNVYHEPIDIFDRHLYEKGGCVLHMLRTELGDARFWKAVRHYVQKHKGGSVETRDLARAVEEATGWNSDRFFHQWVFSAGYPELKVEYSWDDAQKLARVNIKQAQEVKDQTPLFHVPLDGALRRRRRGQGDRLTVSPRRRDLLVSARRKAGCRRSSIPGNHFLKTLDMKKPDEVYQGELAAAERAIDRVRAARALGKAGEPTAVEALVKALKSDSFWAVRGESALALAQIKTAQARAAISDAIKSEAHPKARRMLVRALGAFRHDRGGAGGVGGEAARRRRQLFRRGRERADAGQAPAPRPPFTRWKRRWRGRRISTSSSRRASPAWPSCAMNAASRSRWRPPNTASPSSGGARPSRRWGRWARCIRRANGRFWKCLIELLEDPDFRARIAVVEALRVLGENDAVGALAKAQRRDLDGRVRRRAREVQKSLNEHAAQEEAVRGLRESVEKLETENRDLKERLLKIEARLK